MQMLKRADEYAAFLTASTSPVALFERFEGRGYDETAYDRLIIRSGIPTGKYYSHIIIERFREGPTAGSLSFADLQRCFDEYGYFKAEIAPMSSFLNEVKATTACIDPAECLDSDRVFRLEVPWLLQVRLQLPGSAREEERKYLITGAVLSEGRDWMPEEMKGRH